MATGKEREKRKKRKKKERGEGKRKENVEILHPGFHFFPFLLL
jgi:hypothetical protein